MITKRKDIPICHIYYGYKHSVILLLIAIFILKIRKLITKNAIINIFSNYII
jgi:hypothetical protein